VKVTTLSSSRTLAIALLATIVFALQTLGVIHRTSHARHVVPAQELWLAIANGEVVSSEAWQAELSSTTVEANDPWHHHESRADCERFDALCASDTPIATLNVAVVKPVIEPAPERIYAALISARTARAQARAPPHA
jgi:hypothetical protein